MDNGNPDFLHGSHPDMQHPSKWFVKRAIGIKGQIRQIARIGHSVVVRQFAMMRDSHGGASDAAAPPVLGVAKQGAK